MDPQEEPQLGKTLGELGLQVEVVHRNLEAVEEDQLAAGAEGECLGSCQEVGVHLLGTHHTGVLLVGCSQN